MKIINVSKKEWNGSPLADVEVEDNGAHYRATIWKVDKKTKAEFPGFDQLIPGVEIEGRLWNKPGTDSWTIYPPSKPKTVSGGTFGGGMGKALMVEKQKGIEHSQDRKEVGIKTSSTIKMAQETALAEIGRIPFDGEMFKARFQYWRKYYWNNWEYDNKNLNSNGDEVPF